MTIRRRQSSAGLSDEAARRRRELRDEQDRHAATWAALREANRTLIRLALRERLANSSDFEIYVGMDQVTDELGHIDWNSVSELVDQLVQRRPHFGVSALQTHTSQNSALEWLATGTQRPGAGVPGHGAQGATRDRPGAGERETP